MSRDVAVVVVYPDDRQQVAELWRAYHQQRSMVTGTDGIGDMQTALRSLIAPPKPEEPTGLGAVVEDADGDRWVRIDAAHDPDLPWRSHGTAWFQNWRGINAVRVLSEGVTA